MICSRCATVKTFVLVMATLRGLDMIECSIKAGNEQWTRQSKNKHVHLLLPLGVYLGSDFRYIIRMLVGFSLVWRRGQGPSPPRLYPSQISSCIYVRGREGVVIHLICLRVSQHHSVSKLETLNTAACAEQSRSLSLFHGTGAAVCSCRYCRI